MLHQFFKKNKFILSRTFPSRFFYHSLILAYNCVHFFSKNIAKASSINSIYLPYADHFFDWLYGPEKWHWSVRGILGSKLIKKNDYVLDLAAGDCIFSGLFYSKFAKEVHAIDRNPKAISVARKRYKNVANLKIYDLDIINQNFPRNNYNVIFMFMAIEHFNIEDTAKLLKKIADSLLNSSNGTFLGCTPIFESADQLKQHFEHEKEYTSREELERVLKPFFNKIEFWELYTTGNTKRRDIYFWCSNIIH